MCMGGDLEDIRFRQNGKQIASFLFAGQDLHKHDRDYLNGHALVNPVQFREALNHLRDILFENLRDNQPSPRLRRANGGRYDHDRKRKNRTYQVHG